MWSFKLWLNEDLSAVADKVFSQRDRNAKMKSSKILDALGIKGGDLEQINQGSLATVYRHPLDKTKLIKVTSDLNDAKNIAKAQRLNSPNVVRLHQSAKVGPKAVALVVDFVPGKEMPYNTNALLSLINGDNWEEHGQAARNILRPDRTRRKTLDALGMNNQQELEKLSRLFGSLAQLEKIGIDIFDFTDNILDNGTDYVIVDLGM